MENCECLDAVLSPFEGKREELIPILQRVQEEFGYLPQNAMFDIARFARVPESAVYAVATFYAQFRFTPIGKTHVMVCRGTACHVRGATRILEALESQLGIKEGETTEDLILARDRRVHRGLRVVSLHHGEQESGSQVDAQESSQVVPKVRQWEGGQWKG